MHKLIGIVTTLIVLMLPFMFHEQVSAAPSNAKDCIEGKADCKDLDTDSGDKKIKKEDTEITSGAEKTSLIVDIFKMIFALAIVIILIYLLLKFLQKRNKLFSQVKAMENLGGISVGSNKSLQLVRIGSRVYVIGVGENVDLLQEITDEEVKTELLTKKETDANKEGVFASLLSQVVSRNETKTNETGTGEFRQQLSAELSKQKGIRQKILGRTRQKDEDDE